MYVCTINTLILFNPSHNSLTDIDVANADGHKLAQSTPVSDDAGRGLLISLGGRPRIRVVNEASGHSMHEAPSPDLYAKLKAKITNAGRVKLKREELDALCTEVMESCCICQDNGPSAGDSFVLQSTHFQDSSRQRVFVRMSSVSFA